jgi:hypothetical protein
MGKESCIGCGGSKGAVTYNTNTQEYTKLRSVPVDKLCNGVTVINKGNTIVTWNNLPLNPGESMAVGGNAGEVFIGRIDLNFKLPTPAPAAPVNSAWVIQKFYTDKSFV